MAILGRDTSKGNISAQIFLSLELDGEDPGLCERPRVLAVLSSLLDRVVARNEREVVAKNGQGLLVVPEKMTVFHGLRAPSISIEKYLERIFKYSNCSPSCFVVAYSYIDRFIQKQPGIPITSLNVHRLLITTVMVAAKFLDDAYYNNAYYAKVGGVTTAEMNRLEMEFLFRLDFRLQVTVNMFEDYCAHLEREVMLGEIVRWTGLLLSGVVWMEFQMPSRRCEKTRWRIFGIAMVGYDI